MEANDILALRGRLFIVMAEGDPAILLQIWVFFELRL